MTFDLEYEQTLWINVSLDEFKMCLKKPTRGLYIDNTRILPFWFIPIENPIIIRDIDVEIGANSDRFEIMFFIDDDLKARDYYFESPGNWTWDERCFGKYNLKVIVLGDSFFYNNIAGKEITVWKFL